MIDTTYRVAVQCMYIYMSCDALVGLCYYAVPRLVPKSRTYASYVSLSCQEPSMPIVYVV